MTVTSSASSSVSGGSRPGIARRQECLAGARRPDEQQVVTPRQRHFQRPAGVMLTANLAEVDGFQRAGQRRHRPNGASAWLWTRQLDRSAPLGTLRSASTWSCDQSRRVVQALHADRLDATHQARLGLVRGGHDHPPVALASQRRDHRQHARHSLDRARQRQLAEQRPCPAAAPDLPRCHEDPDGDGQVICGTALAPVGRGEIDRYARCGIVEAAVPNGAANPFPRLGEGRVRQSHDVARRQTWGDVDLDADQLAAQAIDHRSHERREHGAHARRGRLPAS